MSKKQIELGIKEATEKIIGKVSREVKGEIFKKAIEQDKDVQDLVGEILKNEIEKKKS